MSGTNPDEGMAVDEDKAEDGEAGGVLQYACNTLYFIHIPVVDIKSASDDC